MVRPYRRKDHPNGEPKAKLATGGRAPGVMRKGKESKVGKGTLGRGPIDGSGSSLFRDGPCNTQMMGDHSRSKTTERHIDAIEQSVLTVSDGATPM